MSTPKFFTDEDLYAAVAPALRKAGFDAVSVPESGRRGESDESQLAWAAYQDRVLVTFNVAHFAALHTSWLKRGRHMQASSPPANSPLATCFAVSCIWLIPTKPTLYEIG